LEKPQIPIARHVDETFDHAAVAPIVDQDRRRHFVPVPGIIWMVLVVAFDLSRRHIESDRRRRVEIISGALISHPWAAIPRAEKGEVCLGIVVARTPTRRAAGFPLFTVGPGLAAGFAGRGNCIRPPLFLTGVRIQSGDEAANSELAS